MLGPWSLVLLGEFCCLYRTRTIDQRIYRTFAMIGILFLIGSTGFAAEPAGQVASLDWAQAGKPPRSAEDLRGLNERLVNLTSKIVRCTVQVKNGKSCGSGVIVSQEGHVLTAAHVVTDERLPIQIQLSDSKQLQAAMLGKDHRFDVAALKIDIGAEWPYAETTVSSPLSVGKWCLALGHAGCSGGPSSLRLGRILATWNSAVATDCALDHGDSGGPLFDIHGNLIGIHSTIGNHLTENLHLPIQSFWDHRQQLFSEMFGSESKPVRDHVSTALKPPRFRRPSLLRGTEFEVGKNHEVVKRAFKSIIALANNATVKIYTDRRIVVLGTVCDADGHVVTKANRLNDSPICVTSSGQRIRAKIVGHDPELDLAILKLSKTFTTTPPRFRVDNASPVGSIVAIPIGAWDYPLAVGIVGRDAHRVSRSSPTKSAANTERRGLRGYKKVFEHDAVVHPQFCGGPVVDVHGLVVGIHIARATRTIGYAVPSHEVMSLLEAVISVVKNK